MIVKMYRAFEKMFLDEAAAEHELEGWEHKESLVVFWVAVRSLEELPPVFLYDEMYEHVLAYSTNMEAVTTEYEEIKEMEWAK